MHHNSQAQTKSIYQAARLVKTPPASKKNASLSEDREKMTLTPPTIEQQRVIDQEHSPDTEMRKQDIVAIKEWLDKQPHLPKHFGILNQIL